MIRRGFHYILRLFVHFYFGKNITNTDNIVINGPAIIVANHNSHVDTMVLLTMFNCSEIVNVHVVGAADYFFKNRLYSWLSRNLVGAIPLYRHKVSADIFKELYSCLDRGKIVIMFPEGSRGEPGKVSSIKRGIAVISEKYPKVPIYPIRLNKTEDSMPKGRKIPIPFIINLDIKDKFYFTTSDEVIENVRIALSDNILQDNNNNNDKEELKQ